MKLLPGMAIKHERHGRGIVRSPYCYSDECAKNPDILLATFYDVGGVTMLSRRLSRGKIRVIPMSTLVGDAYYREIDKRCSQRAAKKVVQPVRLRTIKRGSKR